MTTSRASVEGTPIVDVKALQVSFRTGGRNVQAVNGIDLDLMHGDTLAILGESGSGKSVTLRALIRLNPAHVTTVTGRIVVAGQDVMAMSRQALQDFRGGVASMIFQDPGLALDPVYRIGDQIAETVVRHKGSTWAEARAKTLALLERVRIPSPERRLQAYPHELSGGMRQRAMIALALSSDPRLLLADEPTTALDATVQIQILLILRELKDDFGLSVIFVTHDIGVAVEVADRISVMYAGRIVETGPVEALIRQPRHPYTVGLLSTRAKSGRLEGRRLPAIPGSPPDLADLPRGCAFEPRCKLAVAECGRAVPELLGVDGEPGHHVRCIRANETGLPDAASDSGAQGPRVSGLMPDNPFLMTSG